MMRQLVLLCGMTALVLTQTASEKIRIVLDFPLERQVFQRNAEEGAAVKVAGSVPTNTTLVEVKAERS